MVQARGSSLARRAALGAALGVTALAASSIVAIPAMAGTCRGSGCPGLGGGMRPGMPVMGTLPQLHPGLPASTRLPGGVRLPWMHTRAPGSVTSATQDDATTDTVNARGEFPVAPFDETQSLEGQQDIFNQGGDDLGRGAGELVSATYLGGPQGILDIPAHLLGFPKPLAYLNEG